MPCNIELLDGVALFQLLDADQRPALAEVVDYQQLPAGEQLFHAGEPGESLFIVHSGQIELYIKDTAGQKIVLTVAGSGDLFGELSLLDTGPRTATAVALEDAGLLVLDREDLLLLFQKNPDTALHMLAGMSTMTRKADELLRTRVSRNVNEEVEERLTVVQRVADWLAWFSGSIAFLVIHALWFGFWIMLNVGVINIPRLSGFDPFPFGLLTMIVSLEAIFLATFVLISQNRQVEKDKVRGDIEYDVNIKAEMEVGELHQKIDHIHAEMLRRFIAIEKTLARQEAKEKV